MTIQFFRPVQGTLATCKECGKKIYNKKESITMAASLNWKERWALHQQCFCDLRERMNKVNSFRVKEVGDLNENRIR